MSWRTAQLLCQASRQQHELRKKWSPLLRYPSAVDLDHYARSHSSNAQTVRSNRESSLELAQQTTEYMYAIACTYDASIEHDVDDHFHSNVELLHQYGFR